MLFRYNILIALFVLTGCIRMCNPPTREEMTPKEVVEGYLQVAFNLDKIEEKELLLDFVAGNLKASLSRASENVIKDLYLTSRYKLESFYVADAKYKTPSECEVLYHVSYSEKFDSDRSGEKLSELQVKAENLVSLIKINGVWFIQGVVDKRCKN